MGLADANFFLQFRSLPRLTSTCQDVFITIGKNFPRLRARPKGAALWNPAAFVKAGETFACASRASIETLVHIFK